MNPRPTPITVFGILNIIFGIISLIGAPLSLFGVLAMRATNNPLAAIYDIPAIRLWSLLSGSLNLLGALVLLAAGIGLLQMRSWSRLLSIGYAIYAILMAIGGGVFNLTVMMPAMMAHMQQIAGNTDAARAGAIGGVVGGILGSFIALIYPILLILFLTRPYIIQALEGSAPIAPTINTPREF